MQPFKDDRPVIDRARQLLGASDSASDADVMVMIFDRAVVAPDATLSMTNFEDPRRIIEIVTSLLGIE